MSAGRDLAQILHTERFQLRLHDLAMHRRIEPIAAHPPLRLQGGVAQVVRDADRHVRERIVGVDRRHLDGERTRRRWNL